MKSFKFFSFQSIRMTALVCVCMLVINGCSGSSGSGGDQSGSETVAANMDSSEEQIIDSSSGEVSALTPVQASLELVQDKTFRITWQATPSAKSYRVLENPDGVSGFSDISGELDTNTISLDHRVSLYSRVNAQYLVQACNDQACVDSEAVMVTNTLDGAIGYFKASNTESGDNFGSAVALSADGNTMAVGAVREDSVATAVNGDQGNDPNASSDNTAGNSGAVYVFVRNGGLWNQQAYIKASNAGSGDSFGGALSLSADGNTLAVGAYHEGSNAVGINGDQNNNSALSSGAVYMFVRGGEDWQQQAYIKSSNSEASDQFGWALSLSADGLTLAVAAPFEDSATTGINGVQNDNSLEAVGAVYVFFRSGDLWQQQAYVKASNSGQSDNFGRSVSLSADGSILAVGASFEDSVATGINGDQNDNSLQNSGAVYVFVLGDEQWTQQAYLKASVAGRIDLFGSSVSLNADGNTLAVGAYHEGGATTGINGDQNDGSFAPEAGAVYVFIRSGERWQQQAYVKASNADEFDRFGYAISLSADGNALAVGAVGEDSAATGINGHQDNEVPPGSGGGTLLGAGAVYVFIRNDELWQQQAYVKASNTSDGRAVGAQNVTSTVVDGLGFAVGLSADGNTLAIGAIAEESAAMGINGDQNDNSAGASGAVYVY